MMPFTIIHNGVGREIKVMGIVVIYFDNMLAIAS